MAGKSKVEVWKHIYIEKSNKAAYKKLKSLHTLF
jgi:hypothetical protein